MNKLVWNDLSDARQCAALARPPQRSDFALRTDVRFIVDDVRARGWEAVAEHALRLDGTLPNLVPVRPIAAAARKKLKAREYAAIQQAHANITAFHTGDIPTDHLAEIITGLRVGKRWRPLDRVGLYVPGGKTPLFSTLMMLAIPARAAGVEEIVTVTPPRPEGGLDPLVALAAELCGIEAIWTVGGAQAIAALGFGAGDIPRVAKICGPGNAWVAEAKNYLASLSGGTAIDMPAGPSELLVIADADADPGLVAADLLSQAEHDPSAQIMLVTTSVALGQAVEVLLTVLGNAIPRSGIAAAALANARIIFAESVDQAISIANRYAPEHLSLNVRNANRLVDQIRNAGAIFAGPYAAETLGDYLAGSSHVLPTDGAARAWSGVSVHTFMKAISVQYVTPEAADKLAAPAAILARLEGLEAHALAAEARIDRNGIDGAGI